MGFQSPWRENIRNQDTLIFAFLHQVTKSAIRHGIDMGFGILSGAALVHPYVLVCVDRQGTVWVNSDQEQARVGLCDH